MKPIETIIEADAGIYIVAAGAGAGAAARVVRERLGGHAMTFATLAQQDGPHARAKASRSMELALLAACDALWRNGQGNLAATCDAIVVCGRLAVIGHVGDGRVDLARAGQVSPLTEDHSVVVADVKVLLRALGKQPAVPVDTLVAECVPGDVLSVRDADGQEHAAVRFPTAERTADDALALSKIAALQSVPLFAHLEYRELQAVLALPRVERFAKGATLLEEGGAGSDFLVLVDGRVAVEAGGRKIAERAAGEPVGEMGLVEDAPRSATVRALEPATALRFTRDEVFELMRSDPALGLKLSWGFLQLLSLRLRDATAAMIKGSAASRVPLPFRVAR